MGLSRLDALVIKTNEVNVETYKNKETKKYGFIISRFENGNYRMIVSSNAEYETKRKARQDCEELVREIKKMEISSILA